MDSPGRQNCLKQTMADQDAIECAEAALPFCMSLPRSSQATYIVDKIRQRRRNHPGGMSSFPIEERQTTSTANRYAFHHIEPSCQEFTAVTVDKLTMTELEPMQSNAPSINQPEWRSGTAHTGT